jgi:outer membrane protein OmpA-like peptidoglycan-associated protein
VAAAAGLHLRAAAPGVVLPGAILTIAGRFRAPPDAVLVGGVRPLIVSRSATLVRVIVPNLAPGRARLTVVVGGRRVSSPAAIAIAAPPNQPPVANLVSYPRVTGAGFVFDATLSVDPEGPGLPAPTKTEMALGAGLRSVLWRFGDGSTSTAPLTTHTYRRPGTYTASLEVTDADGQTGTASQTVRAVRLGATATSLGRPPTRRVNIRIPSQIVFDFGSFALRGESRRYLRRVGRVVRRAVGVTRVAGYTDSIGPAPSNLVLSLRRARVVRAYLAARGPIALGRLRAVGYGESRPLASNATELGRQKNRRVVLTFLLPNRSFARV